MDSKIKQRSLANTYRPKKFGEVVGQKDIVEILKRSIQKSSIYPAYLFEGPWGTGKTTLARILAKRLLCLNPVLEDSCDNCDSCRSFDLGNNDNYLEVDAATHSGVADIKKIIEFAARGGWSSSSYKVIVLDEAHDISTAGQDKLLKSLEEAREGLVFMFCTTAGEALLETVRSRSIIFTLEPPSLNDVKERLRDIADKENIKIDDRSLILIAAQSDLHLRDAIKDLEVLSSFSDDIGEEVTKRYYGLDDAKEVLEFLENLCLSAQNKERSVLELKRSMEIAYKISVNKGVSHFLKILETVLADILRFGFGHIQDMRVLSDKDFTKINFIVRQLHRKQALIFQFVRECRRHSTDLDSLHANVLYLHVLVLQDVVFRADSIKSTKDLIKSTENRTHEEIKKASEDYDFMISLARKKSKEKKKRMESEEEQLEILSEESFINELWRTPETEKASPSEEKIGEEIPFEADTIEDEIDIDALVGEETASLDVGGTSENSSPGSFGEDSFFTPES